MAPKLHSAGTSNLLSVRSTVRGRPDDAKEASVDEDSAFAISDGGVPPVIEIGLSSASPQNETDSCLSSLSTSFRLPVGLPDCMTCRVALKVDV